MHMVNRSQNRYSFVYVFVVLSIFTYVSIKSLGGGIKGFEQNIFKKQYLIATYNHLRYRLGDKIFPQVVVGNDGWLTFNSDGNLDSYQNVNLLKDRLEVIHSQTVDLNKYLKSRGITLIVVVAPNKETI